MSRFAACSVEDVTALRAKIEAELSDSTSLQRAAQKLADLLYDAFAESAVLFRIFGTVATGALPERDRAFALALAEERRSADQIDARTPVVALLGTRGRRAGWNDRYRSQRHLAIPLTQASFIKTIPMISRLMSDMGTGIDWVEKQKSNMVVRTMGQMARVLYVEDAQTARTADGFKVVPDQEFVVANDVRTVLGLGGAYLDRTVVAVILFTRELVPQESVPKLMPLIHAFKIATMGVVMKRRIFD